MISLIFNDIISFLLVISLYILPVVIIIKIYNAFKRYEKRKNEMIEIDKQNTLLTQKSLEKMNTRLNDIEKILKDIDK